MTDQSEWKLAPCPFCGGPAKTSHWNGTTQATCAKDHIECAGTDVLSPVAMWNTRALATSPAAPSQPSVEAVAWRWRAKDRPSDDWSTTTTAPTTSDLLSCQVQPLYTHSSPPDALKVAVEALEAVETYIDAIVCYASTINEHEGNRVAKVVQAALATIRAQEDGG